MLIVGLTGGIGSGKTTVAALLASHGAHVIDVDGLGREIISPNGAIIEQVLERFGESLRLPDNSIDRAALAQLVFDDPAELAALNQISHPAINALIDERLDQHLLDQQLEDQRPTAVAVLDMAVLAESSLGRDNRHRYEVVATVEAPPDVRLERLIQRGMSNADALARMAAQATDEQRSDLADFVVGNGGTLADLEQVVLQMWEHLAALAQAKLS